MPAAVPDLVAPILPAFPTEAGRSEAQELRARSEEGLRARLETQVFTARMPPDERETLARGYRERMDYELGVIEQMGYASYFLITWDLIRYAREAGIRVGPGRGSAAGAFRFWIRCLGQSALTA